MFSKKDPESLNYIISIITTTMRHSEWTNIAAKTHFVKFSFVLFALCCYLPLNRNHGIILFASSLQL